MYRARRNVGVGGHSGDQSTVTDYEEDRIWVAVEDCPGGGADHPEMEFKLRDGGHYEARCYRGDVDLLYDNQSDAVVEKAG